MPGAAPTRNPVSLIGPIIKRSLVPVLIVECSRHSLKICASPAVIGYDYPSMIKFPILSVKYIK